MYKLVLFDMDGTIADTDGMIVATFIEMYRLYRPDYMPTIDYMLTFSGPPIVQTLTKEFPDLNFDYAFKEYQRISLPNYQKFAKAFPFVRELAEKLHARGIKIGIVTSKHRYPAEYTLKLIDLDGVFDLLIAHDDVKEAKPNPEGIFQAMKHFAVDDKRDVLYVGDTLTDYLTAQNAGIDVALVTWTPRDLPPEAKPTYYIDSFNEFFEVINHGKTN